jgi:hypothetical protein
VVPVIPVVPALSSSAPKDGFLGESTDEWWGSWTHVWAISMEEHANHVMSR